MTAAPITLRWLILWSTLPKGAVCSKQFARCSLRLISSSVKTGSSSAIWRDPVARDSGARSRRRRTLQLLPRPGHRRRLRDRAKRTNPCASHETEVVAVESRRRALQAKRQAAKAEHLETPLCCVRARHARRNYTPGLVHGSRQDRPPDGLDCARPRFSLLALLAHVEAAARLDDADYVDEWDPSRLTRRDA